MPGSNRKRSRVPAGRVERLARLGWLGAELAVGGLYEGARRALGAGEVTAETASALLSPANAQRLVRRLSQLRGAAMKLGQLLSLESADVLPPAFAEALADLRASGDTMPVAQLRRVLGREYGKGWEERFERFEFEPIAAASIGQVHAARTRDGRELALKIQYPGVSRSIDSDVDNVASLLHASRILPVEIDVSSIVAEAKRQLRQEVDYLAEAANQRRFRALVADDPGLWVPGVHDDFTTRRVLAMDFARGVPIEDLRDPSVPQARRDEVGARLQRLMFREIFEFRFVQTDPNFANYLVEPESGRLVLLDFGSTREYAADFVAHYADLCRGALRDDPEAVRAAAIAIGYLRPDDPEERVQAAVELMWMVCEPLRQTGPYDFGQSTLAARARDAGFDLAFKKGFLRAPPAETVFLHRKLAGTFLLSGRIRARVDVRALLEPLL
ncbi:MAG TPA: AarF/ABC1/UbiB kinase family protein [Myxococcota bacterium]|nr:AarF/ABC1/UbiB kinase family protein [Myxococcota bacterium]